MTRPNTPPLLPGAPVVGNLFQLLRDPATLCAEGYAAHGSVFSIRLGPKKAAIFLGPEGHEIFFRETDHSLSLFEAAGPLRRAAGDFGFAPTPEAHKRMRQAMAPLLSREGMARYIAILNDELDTALGRLPPSGELDLNELIRQVALATAIRRVFGDEFRRVSLDTILGHFADVVAGVSMFLPPGLPIPRFLKRDRAVRAMRQMIGRALDERKGREVNEDAISHFAKLLEEDPNWTVEDFRSLLFLLLASHEVTAVFASWSLLLALQHPPFLADLREELRTSMTRCPVTGQRLVSRSRHLDGLIRETERLHAPTPSLARMATQDFEANGYTIPKGWLVFAIPDASHRMESVFPRPLEFEPTRFTAEGAPREPKNAIICFGGGNHSCMGRPIAHTAAELIVARMLTELDLELVAEPRVDMRHMFRRPEPPCLLRYRRRPAPEERPLQPEPPAQAPPMAAHA